MKLQIVSDFIEKDFGKLIFLLILLLIYQNFLMIFSPLIGDQIFHVAVRGESLQNYNSFFEHWLDRTAFWLLQ